ncbi:MAG TPA: hypothetical protein PK890_05650 [Terrimesophilobacter sp.]|nr:hypothetical protein [Terrimesophilobacter sp.]
MNNVRRVGAPGALILALALITGCASGPPTEAALVPSTAPTSTPNDTDTGAKDSETDTDSSSDTGDAGTSTTTKPTPPEKPENTAPPATDPPAVSDPPVGPETSDSPSDPPTDAGPALVITSMSCNGSGPHQKLRLQFTANYNDKYRKGINTITFTRPDERGTGWISPSSATWAGQYAGQGNKWSGEIASRNPSQEDYGTGNDYGKVLRVKVRTDDGKHWDSEHLIDRNC